MKKYLIFVLVVIIAVLAIEFMPSVKKFGGTADTNNVFGNVDTIGTATSCAAVSTHCSIMARNANRQYARICNLSAVPVYLAPTSSILSLALTEGITLYTTTTGSLEHCWTIDPSNLYVGEILAISTATATLSVVEK